MSGPLAGTRIPRYLTLPSSTRRAAYLRYSQLVHLPTWVGLVKLSGAIPDAGLGHLSLPGSGPGTDTSRANSESQLRRKVSGVLSVVVLCLPVGAYFWFIHQYAVNVVYLDQWSDVALLRHWYDGTLSFGDLWASHGDHRIFFPNLIAIALAELVHFNVIVEEYFSGVILVAATGLFIATHRRRAPLTPLIYYTPVTLLMFSWVQYQNTLWGFQIAWYLVILALALRSFFSTVPH